MVGALSSSARCSPSRHGRAIFRDLNVHISIIFVVVHFLRQRMTEPTAQMKLTADGVNGDRVRQSSLRFCLSARAAFLPSGTVSPHGPDNSLFPSARIEPECTERCHSSDQVLFHDSIVTPDGTHRASAVCNDLDSAHEPETGLASPHAKSQPCFVRADLAFVRTARSRLPSR
jgi:hypothetical protein